ncbi:MAG: LLM class flavin-dependent oxidoreductase [Pseudomonadales bacterium]|nr:LLM class flavin-dependent oxidoreductase [Pseudomonadales bacterium]
MKVAVTPWSVGSNWFAEDLCEQAVLAEAMGFHSFWLPENHFGDSRAIPSPLTLLATVAGCTTRIKLGTTSYLLTIRHPIQAAEEVATLDQLSRGRLILGVGRGVHEAMFEVYKVPLKEKRLTFQTNLEAMQKAWRGLPIYESSDGKSNDSDSKKQIYLSPLPFQKPYPPIWIAAFGPLALKQAGNLGFPYLASPIETLEVLKQNYEKHTQALALAKHNPADTIPVMRTVFINKNKGIIEALRKELENVPGRTSESKVENWAIIGDSIYVYDKIQEYREVLGMTHLIARGRLPGISKEVQIKSHEHLIKITS